MRPELDESFREGNQYFAGGTAPREAGTADRTPIATPAALWLETADSVFKWYGAILRLAFGLGRMDGRGEAQGLIASPAQGPLMPAESSSIAALHSLRTAPITQRPKRRKRASRDKNGARSSKKNRARASKMSSIKRSHRRAA